MTGKITVERGSGNVFADLDFDNPEEEKLKALLVREIRDIIKQRRLTQAKAAELLGLKQPDVSTLLAGRVHKFSLERLLRCVDRLDQDVRYRDSVEKPPAPNSIASPTGGGGMTGGMTNKAEPLRQALKFARITSNPRQMGGMPCIRGGLNVATQGRRAIMSWTHSYSSL